MSSPKPKQKPKPKKLNLNPKIHWRNIIKDISTDRVPMNIVKTISLVMIDDTLVEINVSDLLLRGMDHQELENYVQNRFAELHNYIKSVNFNINILDIADKIQPATNELLKNICQ